jgi:hypothetical protein
MILCDYSGSYSDELFSGILEMTEEKLRGVENSLKIRKKVFSILVEVFQNLYHHYYNELGDEEKEKHEVRLTIKKSGDHYLIFSGNPVSFKQAESLRNRIDILNSLSQHEIRELYRRRLSDGSVSKNGGAGLGMIDIVRKAGDKIHYAFESLDNNISFFKFEVKISA